MKAANFFLAAIFVAAFLTGDAQIPKVVGTPAPGDARLSDYFRDEVMALSQNCLADIKTLDDWKSKRAEYRRQLAEMLGLWPMPKKTDLHPVITGTIINENFTVEKIYFQALPKLYCTANLYLPKNLTQPAPTILYVCGHWSFKTNGISYGNKAVYQNDGEWFARNGYVCLVLDTVLAGEIQGIHTGTRDHGLWWWNSRGYTPAGIEAFLGIRALDYLCTRAEVDTNRFGITGHSGGGAYSWTITALDDRIKVAAPLAGMADARSHMLDGVIDDHCDCNFFINIYHWDFPQVAALAAPRPLLIGGTDRDPLFHLDSTMRIYEKVRRIYNLYDEPTNLALAIAPGIHMEAPELRLAVLRWFNRFLKHEEPPIAMAATNFFSPMELKVFKTLPTDSINSNIADYFVPMAKPEKMPPAELRQKLREKTFSGWPDENLPLKVKQIFSVQHGKVRLSAWDFSSEHDVSLRVYFLENVSSKPEQISLQILDPSGWTNWLAASRSFWDGQAMNGKIVAGEFIDENNSANAAALEKLKSELADGKTALAFFAPRGIGLDAWSGGEKRLTKIRRRFMLLGQTLDGMRVWDIRRAIHAIQFVRGDSAKIELLADGGESVNTLYAALFEPEIKKIDLTNLPKSQKYGTTDYLGVLKITDIPEVKAAVASQAELKTGGKF
ncbi:MAG: alpha/beta hydrolase family protein [Limisphaerales bacterium]